MRAASNFTNVLSLAAGVVLSGLSVTGARAYTETTLYKFCSEQKCVDGARPTNIVMDKSGNLFGTTQIGGNREGDPFKQGFGTVFEYTPSTGQYQALYKFCPQPGCADGADPHRAKLVIDVNGNLYGTTYSGGINGDSGVVFELINGKSGWSEKVLWSFCSKDNCKDGAVPDAGLTYAGAAGGALYDGVSSLFGTTTEGGRNGLGAVFQLTSKKNGKWLEKIPYSFCSRENCADGASPSAPLYIDGSGNIYGTAKGGGEFNGGAVFDLTANGSGSYNYNVLYNFCAQDNCSDGGNSATDVVIDGEGNLMGTATEGGAKNDGVLYQLSPQRSGRWQYNVLASFNNKDGRDPVSLILGNDGSLLGTTYGGGKHDKGTVFEYSGGTLQTIYNVCEAHKCPEGARPFDIIQDSSGNLFGANWIGGNKNGGTLFELVNDKHAHHAAK